MRIIANFLFFFLSLTAHGKSPIYQEIISSPTLRETELFWTAPEGKGPWPLLVFIHPAQEWPNQIGGKIFVENGTLEAWAAKGWMSVAISQPGFGNSKGPADFCGPASQNAVRAVLANFRARPLVDKNNIVLYGGSRGAVIASMVATQEKGLAGVILRSGLYNFPAWLLVQPWYNLIALTMRWELGEWKIPEEELDERSALFEAHRITAPLLMLHGRGDDRAPIEYAEQLAAAVKKSGHAVEFITFDSEHIIPKEKAAEYMDKFLQRVKK